jgi:Xaa-Pro aminopeptidase
VYSGWQTLQGAGLDLVPRKGVVERLRAVKDDTELAAIREAARITDEVYAAFAEEKFVGRTERDLAWRMEQLFHEHGAHALAFETLVGSGPTGAMPHGRPTDRVVEPNTTVVVDAGAVIDGYNSDCTRTFATGELPDELANAYDVCLRGQLAGLEAMRAGVSGADADATARRVIADAGLGEKFGHGLGHGVGLNVHEAPTARPESTDVLEPRNVITCEPGIYLEGRGGVRIEDLVVITDGEPEILSAYTKELVTVR